MSSSDPAYLAAVEVQRQANRSTVGQWERFAEHRARLTQLLVRDVTSTDEASLGVLGAGNVNDLDLTELLSRYAEVHLFDLDEAALHAASRRVPRELRSRVSCHSGLDLSGALDKLPRWAAMQLTPEELMAHPSAAVEQLTRAIGRVFDRVLSPCLWTQLHLQVLEALGPEHQLLDALNYTTSLTHLRLMIALTAKGGKAVLATELTSNHTAELPPPVAVPSQSADRLELVGEFARSGNVIGVAHPARIAAIVSDDPQLSRCIIPPAPSEAWIWQQGPERRYLTYASWLTAP
jgi:hypothetical protein